MRALGRALSWLEAGDDRGPAVLSRLRRDGAGTDAWRVGVTGVPGGGKSTLTDRLVGHWRSEGERVAVVAVDPSSPFSGGALLGDRIRMGRWHADPGVFVRSMATRGRLGGLAAATLRAAALLEAAGFARIVLETVGVGQSEVDVASAADTTVLVLAPGGGDDVQAVKAGVLEVADVLVINKADLPGADRLRRDLAAAQGLIAPAPDAWTPPLILARADDGDGVADVVDAIDTHRAWRAGREDAGARAQRRAAAELTAALRDRADRIAAERAEAWTAALVAGEATAEEVAERLLPGASDGRDPGPGAVPSEP